MIGKNTVILNAETVRIALQDYFDKTYAQGSEQKILSVKVGTNSDYDKKNLEGLVVEIENARSTACSVGQP